MGDLQNWHLCLEVREVTLVAMTSTTDRLRTLAMYLVVVLIWGTTWIAMKATVETVPTITASGGRLLLAFPILALMIARRGGVPLRYPAGHGRLFAIVTVGYFTVPFVLMNVGSARVASGLAAVLFSSVALFIPLLSVPILRTRISRRQGLGISGAMVALVALIANQVGLAGHASPAGIAALLGAAFMHATSYVLIKRDGGALSPLTLNALPMGLSALLLCGAGAAIEQPSLAAVSSSSLLGLLYLGIVASVIGFLAYFELLRRLSAIPLALVFVLFPVVAQLAAVIGGDHGMGPQSIGLLSLTLACSATALTAPTAAPAPTPPVPRGRRAIPVTGAGVAARRGA